MRTSRSFLFLLAVFSLSACRLHAQGDVVISEFLASNSSGLLDQDGDASDWIELYNAGANMVDLGGWHLTDNPDDLSQWTFPATNLAPNSFLVVFASGKNRAVAGQQLHTSFALASSGEYLALVRQDGTVSQDFAPTFPPQVENISYGLAFDYATSTYVAGGATAKWEVPLSAADYPASWTQPDFDDSAWLSGPTGLGFCQNQTSHLGSGPPTNVALGKVATQSSTYNNDTNNYGPQKAVNGIYSDYSHTFPTNIFATWQVNSWDELRA